MRLGRKTMSFFVLSKGRSPSLARKRPAEVWKGSIVAITTWNLAAEPALESGISYSNRISISIISLIATYSY